MTIKELEQITIRALKEGSIEAFNLCYDLYYKILCSFANFFVKQPEVAEEIAQNIFLELWINREQLPVQSPLKAYLLTAVKHDCLDYLKHKAIREKFASNHLQPIDEAYDDVFNTLTDKELQKHLDHAIDKLPARCREVFMMSRFDYFSYKEIALKLDISVKTVENQIGKALKILRHELDPFL